MSSADILLAFYVEVDNLEKLAAFLGNVVDDLLEGIVGKTCG